MLLKLALEDSAELVRFRPGHIELHLLASAPKDLANDLGRKLKFWTGERWMISVTEERGEKPLGEVRRAEITSVRDLSPEDARAKKD